MSEKYEADFDFQIKLFKKLSNLKGVLPADEIEIDIGIVKRYES